MVSISDSTFCPDSVHRRPSKFVRPSGHSNLSGARSSFSCMSYGIVRRALSAWRSGAHDDPAAYRFTPASYCFILFRPSNLDGSDQSAFGHSCFSCFGLAWESHALSVFLFHASPSCWHGSCHPEDSATCSGFSGRPQALAILPRGRGQALSCHCGVHLSHRLSGTMAGAC